MGGVADSTVSRGTTFSCSTLSTTVVFASASGAGDMGEEKLI